MSTTLLSPNQVMLKLDISYSTLLRKVKSKELPFIRIGKQLRFPVSYFESLETQAMKNMKGGSNE